MDARGASTAADTSDDQKLKLEALVLQFNKCADEKDGKGEQRMSRHVRACGARLRPQPLARGDRFGMNRDGWVDLAEFQLFVASDPELEMLVRSFGIERLAERIVAAKLKKGDSDKLLAGFSKMTDKVTRTMFLLRAVIPH